MFPEFKDDLSQILSRAWEAGVSKIVNVGCSKEASKQAVEMAKADMASGGDFLYATLGLHPYDVFDATDELIEEWEKWILEDQNSGRKRIVAIGEIGLDYYVRHGDRADNSPILSVPKEKQKEGFIKQLEFAVRVGLPVIIHNREADEDTFEILRKFPKARCVFHCFGSNLEFAKKVWVAGFMTSFTGVITYPNASNIREVVKEVPMDKFMVETDCPYLAPQVYRGKRNEPSYVVEVAKMIAEVKGISLEEVQRVATENSERFFKF
jgi:TatD DNase family protein